MKPLDLKIPLTDLFTSNGFEVCEETIDEENLSIFFIKKDFRIEAYFDVSDLSFDLSLDRPFFGFNESHSVSSVGEACSFSKEFIAKIDQLIAEDSLIPKITKEDCELFLKTGSYDGMGSGVIEYKGSLYYITSITNLYFKHRSSEDSKNRVWRHFYAFELTKEELEKVVMSSLDWVRHINLTSLCKDWKAMSLSTGNEAEHKKHFNGKYRYSFEPKNKPVFKLTLFY